VKLRLLPYPRTLRRLSGSFVLPERSALHLDPRLPRDEVLLPVAERLQSEVRARGVNLELITGPVSHPRLAIRGFWDGNAPDEPGGYTLAINARGVSVGYREAEGLRAGAATLRQLLREHGRRLPCLFIRDYADFAKRGVLLDVSRGRVPRLETLLDLTEQLASFKINEFQLYTEHTFAYRNYEPVWRDWAPLTGEEILKLDAHCRRLGIELTPNQNSFGHLRYWLEYPPLRKLAETSQPWPDQGGAFLRYPSTLAPTHPGTLPLLRDLYDELLPHFTSARFNVGCDETWDLGHGQSRRLCETKGKGRVYLDFLKRIHRETTRRKRQMMFWGDIILHYPKLVAELPRDTIALDWGYEAGHPFEHEAAVFARSRVPFYTCPGTSTWMTLIGRHDNAFLNLQRAAEAGKAHGAVGFLNTDWGDGGHPQPLAVSSLPYLVGAALSWCGGSYDQALLGPVASRDIFQDSTGRISDAAHALGLAHRKLKYSAPNVTPLGAVIAAPPPELRELYCRDGLKYYARIPAKNVRAALDEIDAQRSLLHRARPESRVAELLAAELDLAARMAAQSCKYMLWQQALAAGRRTEARMLARRTVVELLQLDEEFNASWPSRNKGTPQKSSPFLRWRIRDYRREVLHFSPEVASVERSSAGSA
jgi:hexosaminidase